MVRIHATDPPPRALWCPPVAPPGAGYGCAVQLQLPACGCPVGLLLSWLHQGGFGGTVHAGLCPESCVWAASVLRAPAAMQQPVGLNRTWWFSVLGESPPQCSLVAANWIGDISHVYISLIRITEWTAREVLLGCVCQEQQKTLQHVNNGVY